MNIKRFLKSPISIWLKLEIRNFLLERKNKKKSLKIGYMAKVTNSAFGINNTICDNVLLSNVVLGDFSYVGEKAVIRNSKIGKFCSVAPNAIIGTGIHPTHMVSTYPIFYSTKKQGQITFVEKDYIEETREIIVGNDVWIGTNAIIHDGITIGDGAIIASGAIVTKNIPPYAIYGGVPAKLIKYRFNQNEVLNLRKSEWWNKDIAWLKKNVLKFHNIDKFIELVT